MNTKTLNSEILFLIVISVIQNMQKAFKLMSGHKKM